LALTLWVEHAVPSFPNSSGIDAQIAGSLMGLVIHLLKGLAFTLLLEPWVGSLNRALLVGCSLGWWRSGASLLILFLASRGRPFMEPGACSMTSLRSELIYGLVLADVSVRILSSPPRVQA
jgi:hypothetical protein